MKNSLGIVYLAGAGPGDPELVTAKTLRLLQSCDAVVYDNLIPDELVITLPSQIERHYVGKRAGKVCRSQDEINELLVTLARAGKRVVRLKGSDPLIFGRGGEEAKFLVEHGIPFEIVPGVTSGLAAAAYAGIPPTDRDLASTLVFVTGHQALHKQTSSVSWPWLAQAKQSTLIVYMGVSEIAAIVGELTTHGLPAETPAAAIERGTFASQRVVTGTLEQLPSLVGQHKISGPAVFVIGEVVRLHESLDWFRGKPLLGLRVMVTRPADQAGWMYQRLRDEGAEVLPCPTIRTTATVDETAWQEFEGLGSGERWLVFTSENGVRYFHRQLLQRGNDIRALCGFRLAVIGAGTSRALSDLGLMADFTPQIATTAALAEEFPRQVDLSQATVVRVRGNLSHDNIDQAAADAGAKVIPLTVYETSTCIWPDEMKEKLMTYPPDVCIFTSGSTADGLAENLTSDERRSILSGACIVSIGPSTSDVISSHGIEVTLEATTHSIPHLIEQLLEFAASHNLKREL